MEPEKFVMGPKFLATAYAGPVTATPLAVGGVSLMLARPAEPDLLLEAPDVRAWNAQDDYMPYWAYLWPGAFLLADHLAGRSDLAGTPCLEIGCGLGLAGLTPGLAVCAALAFTAAFLNAAFGFCLGCWMYVGLLRAGVIRTA